MVWSVLVDCGSVHSAGALASPTERKGIHLCRSPPRFRVLEEQIVRMMMTGVVES